ncbi:protein spire homolog 1 [Chanos chanos]|uniref:Protein spire homolog 1 n=1 Tax=Chanos chanos TaxID=29144 RepID=A0A6J2USX8_CHACN|nr:protein spire homolog 1-like [Chanos chanos]
MSICSLNSCHLSLREILELQNQPVSEEQAWALCYQLCCLIEQSIKHDTATVDYLGRLIYSCLDWGLETNVERELNESLELLVCQMTRVNVSPGNDSFQPIYSISEVIQICEDRLYDPAQASHHYRGVCSTLFSETIELCRYLQNIRSTRETLEKLIVESETRLLAHVTTNWVFTWKHVVEELSQGVVLRPSRNRPENLSVKFPLPVKLHPFNQLLQDIRLGHYTLRKVQRAGNDRRRIDPHEALLEFIRSRPKLQPVSRRKLKLKPKEEPSLHELLMQEIRTSGQLKRLSSCKTSPASKGKCPYLKEKSCDAVQVPMTIADVISVNQTKARGMSAMSCERYRNWRVCSCCSNRSPFFTWHNYCSLCNGVLCPECCVEMRMPFKWCLNLPISFFKKIVLQTDEKGKNNFWKERWSWDCSQVPLVLESRLSTSSPLHTLAMRGWHSQDVCVVCQSLLQEACDSVFSLCPNTGPWEI